MDSLRNRLEKMQDVIGKVLSLSIILLILVVVYTAIMRYLFKATPSWGFDVSVFIFGIYSVMSGAYVLKEKGHVNVDILPSILDEKKKNIINIISSIVIIVVSISIIIIGSQNAWSSTKILERSITQSTFNPQIWWFKWMIPISAILILIQALVDMSRLIGYFKGGKKK